MTLGTAEPVDVAAVAARFGRLLHHAGVPVTAERSGRFAAALTLRPPVANRDLYWLARVSLLSGYEQIDVFDRVFAQVFSGLADPAEWRGHPADRPPARPGPVGPRPTQGAPAGATRRAAGGAPRPTEVGDGVDGGGAPDGEGVIAAASEMERLRSRDFAELSAEELRLLRSLSGRLRLAAPLRRTRRLDRSWHGHELDVRATLRRAHRSGGQPFVAVRRRRRVRPRRLVMLCDVSGSMEPYARAYLQLLLSGVGGAGAEAFVFATRLTRLTRALRGPQPDAAMRRAGLTAPDWAGGTRIGEALRAFNDDHGRRGVARGAVIVILSDGWDRGDPALLGREMARLRRLAHRIIWVNPRRARPAYQPLAGGMAAALPHVDAFLSGHNLEAFEEVLATIRDGRERPGAEARHPVTASGRP